MNIRELIHKNRSYRRFHEDQPVDLATLRELVDLTRHSASSGNKQPLKYFLSADPQSNAVIFPHLRWAGYLEDWPGPESGERPTAYILILGDKRITENFGCDHGIAAQSIMLGAIEKGLGGCILSSVARVPLTAELGIADHFHILLALALGVPKETVVIDPLGPDGDIRYWRDPDGIHHVPKRLLDDLIVN